MADTETNDVEHGKKNVAPIKKEFLLESSQKVINYDFVDDSQVKIKREHSDDEQDDKRPKVDDRDLNPKGKFKLRGQNKNKLRYQIGKKAAWSRGNKKNKGENQDGTNQAGGEPVAKVEKLCLRWMEQEGKCLFGDKCDRCHDLYKIYKSNEDEYFEPNEKPCYIYKAYGRCHFGTSCLFSKSHINLMEEKQKVHNLIDHKIWSLQGGHDNFIERAKNKLDSQVQHRLRKKMYDFKVVDEAIKCMFKADNERGGDETTNEVDNSHYNKNHVTRIGAALVDDFKHVRDNDRKKVDFRNKLYLAPLTTVGNLPFRRLCKKFSCDITCAEMSLCSSLLNGNPSEWSHLRRHDSEDVFGVQITGTHPEHTSKIVKVLNEQCEVDFIDLNCGCPTEFIYQMGAGSGLMQRPSKLRKMIAGAAMISKVPITIKLRAGCQEDKNTAHNLINTVVAPFTSKYIGCITVHPRSRAQRYTKLADWHYANECGRYAGDIPLFGSGDCISWQEYYQRLEDYKCVSGVMLARGALIAPWLFTEIRERRTWDISSRERLDIIQDYVNFALDHWGSDAQGVENSRRYLLEWLSFANRYIPVGLLEVLPQRINDRPPAYRGRDELETLLSSPSASDWVKISEMFLGKVPDGFKFLPKHKANAYESQVEG